MSLLEVCPHFGGVLRERFHGKEAVSILPYSVIWRVLSLNEPIDEAIEASRLHHQLVPNQVQVEGEVHCTWKS